VELTEQYLLPHLANLYLWVFVSTIRDRCNCGEKLNIPHQEFGSSVVFLGAGLSGIGTTMQFKVQITSPGWKHI
jgi:uncharacterized protein (DUF983 family)